MISINSFISDFSKVRKSLNRRRRANPRPRRSTENLVETDLFDSAMDIRKLVGVQQGRMIYLTDKSDDQVYGMDKQKTRKELRSNGLLVKFNPEPQINEISILDELCHLQTEGKFLINKSGDLRTARSEDFFGLRSLI